MSEPTATHVETKHSDSMGDLSKALSNVQASLPVIPKNRKGYGYNFADINDILKEVLPRLHDAGLSLMQSMEVHNGQPYMMTMLSHWESNQWIKSYTRMFVNKADSQGLGASLTYSRRYGLCSILAISSDEDTDGVLGTSDTCTPPSLKQPVSQLNEDSPWQ